MSAFLKKIKQAEAVSTELTTPLLSTPDLLPPLVVPPPPSPYPVIDQSSYNTAPVTQVTTSTTTYNKLIYDKLAYAVRNNNLGSFYPPDRLQQLATQISTISLQDLANEFKINTEVAIDLYQLALYDIVIIADDSGSMQAFEERIDELKVIVEKIANVASRFDQDGLTLRFLNSTRVYENIKSGMDASRAIQNTSFSGPTPIGRALNRVLNGVTQTQLRKPVLCITVTDGEPDSKDDVYNMLLEAKNFNKSRGVQCIEFEFAQVGNDRRAQQFLYDLDVHPLVGDIVDVTSGYEMEEQEFLRAGVNLTPYMWILKLMLGTIDPQYDAGDESKQ